MKSNKFEKYECPKVKKIFIDNDPKNIYPTVLKYLQISETSFILIYLNKILYNFEAYRYYNPLYFDDYNYDEDEEKNNEFNILFTIFQYKDNKLIHGKIEEIGKGLRRRELSFLDIKIDEKNKNQIILLNKENIMIYEIKNLELKKISSNKLKNEIKGDYIKGKLLSGNKFCIYQSANYDDYIIEDKNDDIYFSIYEYEFKEDYIINKKVNKPLNIRGMIQKNMNGKKKKIYEKEKEDIIKEIENNLKIMIQDVLEIKSKNILIISVSEFCRLRDMDKDYRIIDNYYTIIYDLVNLNMITFLSDIFHAQKIFYFENNDKYANKIFGFDNNTFNCLNLTNFQLEYSLNEHINENGYYYYHHNLFLGEEGIFYSIGGWRSGYWHSMIDGSHWCVIDENNKKITEIHFNNEKIRKEAFIYKLGNYYILINENKMSILDFKYLDKKISVKDSKRRLYTLFDLNFGLGKQKKYKKKESSWDGDIEEDNEEDDKDNLDDNERIRKKMIELIPYMSDDSVDEFGDDEEEEEEIRKKEKSNKRPRSRSRDQEK